MRVVATERKEMKGRTLLTLHGSSETHRSVSFGHPRLEFIDNDERVGRGETEETEWKGKGRFGTRGDQVPLCFSKISNLDPTFARGTSRCHETVTRRRVTLYSLSGALFVFSSPLHSDAKSRFKSCCVYVSRRSVATDLRETYACFLIPVYSSPIHSFVNRELPRLL